MSNTYLISEETLDALASEIQRLQGTVGKLTPQQQINFLKTVKTKSSASYTPGRYNSYIPAGTYLKEQQTIVGDYDLVASNIKSGVTIFNVTGTYTGTGGITPSGTKYITSNAKTDVSNYQYAQVQDSDLIAANIRNGVNILGVTGTYTGSGSNPFIPYYYTVAEEQTINIPWPSYAHDYFVANSHDWDAPAVVSSINSTGLTVEGIYEGQTKFRCAYTYGEDDFHDKFIELIITVTAKEPDIPDIPEPTTNTGNVTDWVSGGTEKGVSSVTSWSYGNSNSKTIDFPSPIAWVYGGSEEGAKDVTAWRD